MKTRHLVLTAAAAMLLAACTQSGFRNVDYFAEGVADDVYVVRVSALEQKAAGGNPVAQRLLGNMYYWGEHMDQNETKAIAWWSRAADKGDAEAQLNLAKATAGEPVKGVTYASVGREYWASVEEGYFAATDEFETTILPFQDTALGEDPAAEEQPSVMEKVLTPIANGIDFIVETITGRSAE